MSATGTMAEAVAASAWVVQRALTGYVPFALPVVRHGNLLADSIVRPVAARQLPDPRDLLVHCAPEMNHLPELHARFG